MIDLRLGDCLEVLKEIPDNSVDMVLCDLPYGEVNQKSSGLRLLDRGSADTCEIDLQALVAEWVRIASGSIYAFCGTEQISLLVTALKLHGLTTRVGVWEKSNPSPMNGTRLWLSGLEFCVFARKANATFNEHCKPAVWRLPVGRSTVHPTQKPVALMERLILASTNEGETVLDNCMGSGTTGVACVNTGRNFIGIEREPEYYEIARARIESAQQDLQQTLANMKYIITAIVTICLTAGSMAQGINYRIGGILGEDKPYMVVGVNLFELAPNSDMWAETVAFTSFDVNEAWGGFGIRKDWKQGTYTVSGAISVVNRVDQSINFENTRIAASVGVKF